MKSKFARKAQAEAQAPNSLSIWLIAQSPIDWQICRRKCACIAGTTENVESLVGGSTLRMARLDLPSLPFCTAALKRNQFPL